MPKSIHRICILLVVLVCLEASASNNVIRIASGGLLDGYFNTSLKLCRYISASNNGIKCQVVPTSGSLENLWLLQRNQVEFAFAMSNLVIESYNGTGHFTGTVPFKGMFQLLRLHDECFTMLARDTDNIKSFQDIDGLRISNGPAKSDSTVVYEAIVPYYSFNKEPYDVEFVHEEYAKNFCEKKVNVVMLMTGHPCAIVNMITNKCDTEFVAIDSNKLDEIIKNYPGFKRVSLGGDLYPDVSGTVDTLAVSTALVSSVSVDKAIITNLMNYLKTRIDKLKLADPVLYDLDDEHFTSGFVIPGFMPDKK
ncbi:MAG: TAXI family TRAP transporter solute-binding subunit [Rickettsiales bacterium]|nr:TAXI family TRAP transporter solute-binding subunit [Rickettsiales bacterium]MCA0254127.1 TAXI family TRAP transporter solute-binding subunit [Pseudomonadota bacterium]